MHRGFCNIVGAARDSPAGSSFEVRKPNPADGALTLQGRTGFPSICNPDLGVIMRPLGWIGVLLIIAGLVIVAMRGIPYTKSQNEVQVGPLQVTTEERGLVTPIVGVGAIVLGAVLVFAGRGRSAPS